MSMLRCKMCGGSLEMNAGAAIATCEYCGTSQTVPAFDSEKITHVPNRANDLRRACEFDQAAMLLEGAASEFPNEAEVYWGILLCEYGIEYVDDFRTHRKIPTCHRASFSSVLTNVNYLKACSAADSIARRAYEKEGRELELIRSKIIEQMAQQEPYDVFICYKDLDENDERTEDSVFAQQIYDELRSGGIRVFFSRITLENALGNEFEPIIFAALNSARVMLAFGTNKRYLYEPWVKNEWMRFLRLIERGEQKKTLIPCYKNMSPRDLPAELACLQGQDLSKIGCVQDIVRGVMKLVGTERNGFDEKIAGSSGASGNVDGAASVSDTPPGSSSMTLRGQMLLEEGKFAPAWRAFDRALDQNPTDGYAHLGKFLAKSCRRSLDEFKDRIARYKDDVDFQRAMRFATPNLQRELSAAYEIDRRNIEVDEERRKRQEWEARERAEKKRVRDEACRKHKRACDEIEKVVQAELVPVSALIRGRYDPQIKEIRDEMGADEALIMRKQVQYQMEISKLKRRKSVLGVFASDDERGALDKLISVVETKLSRLPSLDSIREAYGPQIEELVSKRDDELKAMEAAIRKHHPKPSLGQFLKP